MNRRPDKHVFGWEEEPADERPSEFRQSSMGYSVLSGYYASDELNARAARRRSGSGLGFKAVVGVFLVLLAVSGVAIHEVIKLLR